MLPSCAGREGKRTSMRLTSILLSLFLLVMVGCTTTTEPATPTTGSDTTLAPTEAVSEPETPATPVTLAMGYIPNVQFAPFYVALEKGFFAEEGIDLTLDYGMENDLIELVAANQLQFAIAGGDQVLLGRSGGRPIQYVANWYRRFPVAVTSINGDISDPKALEGQTVGLPGLYGANYIGWLALVQATGINPESVSLEAIGFNQVPVLAQGDIDAAVVYAMNEPLQLEQEGYTVSTILVADHIDLVANGLITNDETAQNNPELVRGMVRAMLRGIEYTLQHPEEAFEITRQAKYGTGISDENAETQQAVLNASLDFWRNETPGLLPDSAWQTSETFMVEAGLLSAPAPLDTVYTNEFLP
jgi:NitT/TauT family transport system substrate-binding protein